MKRNGYANVRVVFFAIALVVVAFSNVPLVLVEQEQFDPWDYPHLDTMYFKVIKTSDARVDALTVTEEVDMIPGPTTTSNIEKVQDWGANMSWAPSGSYSFMALQCRDVWPEEAAGGDEGKTPGETTSPMNYSSFRLALTYIFGMDDKNATIRNCRGPSVFGIQSVIPPAQARWWDPTAQLSVTNFATAWALLEAAGFYIDETTLYDPNGLPCRDLIVYYGGGPWWEMLPDFVAAFNNFMDEYLGVTNCNLIWQGKDFATLIYGNLLATHDYDMIAIGLTGLGADCDWIVSMFHSDNDVPWGWNFVGVHDPYVDHLMDIITYSTNPIEIKQTIFDFQHYFNGEMPQSAMDFGATGKGMMPHFLWSSDMTIESYHPALENWIPQPCYGSEQCELTWAYIQWDMDWVGPPVLPPTAPTVVRRALADEPTNLNPFYEETRYGWLMLDGPLEGLLQPHPKTLEPKPWLAHHYTYDGPITTTTPSGKQMVDGMRIDYYIRPGVYWQDTGAYNDTNGNDQWDPSEPKYEFPFTSYDVKFAADMMMKHWDAYCRDAYCPRWNLIEVSTEGPYKVTFWYDASSYWYLTDLSALSYFPQHIYQKADKMVDDGLLEKFSDFKPAFTNYEEWMGIHPPDEWGTPPTGPGKPGYWSALVGTGPFIFGYYNVETMIGETYRNTRYWGGGSAVQQSLETVNERHGIDCFKKIEDVETITFETTTLDVEDPACTYLHEIMPTLSNSWHIDGWKDLNGDGILSPCDEVTLSKDVCGNGQWQGQGEYHVNAVDPSVDVWTVVVAEVEYIPGLTHTYIVVDGENMVWWHNDTTPPPGIDVYYEVFCDTTEVGKGWVMDLGVWDDFAVEVPITDWYKIPSCLHIFTVDFYVRVAGTTEEPHYSCSVSREFAYVVADTNCDSKADMKDIYAMTLAFHSKQGHPRYNPSCDINNDGKVDMKDIYICIIMFGKECGC